MRTFNVTVAYSHGTANVQRRTYRGIIAPDWNYAADRVRNIMRTEGVDVIHGVSARPV